MKLTKPQKEELLRMIREKPKSMQRICAHYGITVIEAQKIARMATVRELKMLYEKENN